MSEDERRVVVEEIDALVAIDVRYAATVAACSINRIGSEGNRMTGVSAGHDLRSAVIQLPR